MADRRPRKPRSGSLGADLAGARDAELFETLAVQRGVRIERIVSTGQVTPPGEWYDQPHDEWVAVIAGAAHLRIEGEENYRKLEPGDWVLLPAHCRHRVTWTQDDPPTVWLAVHFAPKPNGSS
jgi:cupin 2 domain-containing protein